MLRYDGYRLNMSLRVLKLFDENETIVYALPAHMSSKTQPCEVVLFGEYKKCLNKLLHDITGLNTVIYLDMYDYCSIMTQAYHFSHIRPTIIASFGHSGLRPVNYAPLSSVPRPQSMNDLETVL